MMNTWKRGKTMILFGVIFLIQAATFWFFGQHKLALVILACAIIDLICGIIERNRENKATEGV